MVLTDKLNRAATLAIASLLLLASLVPLLNRQKADAYSLLPNRSITMSTSQISATSTTYHVRFTIPSPPANTTLGSIVVDFCDNSPIIGDTSCTAVTGLNIGTPTISGQSDATGNDTLPDPVTGAAVADTCNLSTFTTATALTTTTLALTSTAPPTVAGGQNCFFDITTVTNPSTVNHTFYARIYTFQDTDDDGDGCATGSPNYTDDSASCYTAALPKVFLDAGGVAMSTAQQINITAKVQERLTFCVYTFPTIETAPGAGDWTDTPSQADVGTGNDCAGKSGSDIILGDENGVLDPAQSYVDKTSYFSITTNASGQAAVRMKGDTLELTPACAAATCRIDAIYDAAPNDGLPEVSAAGLEQFGMCLYKFDNVVGSTFSVANGTVTGDTDYTGDGNSGQGCVDTRQSAHVATAPAASNGDGGTGHGASSFSFDVTNLNTTPYGQIIARKQAGGFTTARLGFIGNIANTTEPGIYRTTLTFIATGTY